MRHRGLLRRADRRSGGAGAHAGRDPAPRARRAALPPVGCAVPPDRERGRQRAAARAPVDHRSASRGRPADVERRRRHLDLVQRRGVRLAGRRGRAPPRGRRLPHPLRHRVHPPRLRGARHGLPPAAARHVRLRHRGPAPEPRAAGARPDGRQAARVRPPRRRARVRLDGAGGAALSAGSAPRVLRRRDRRVSRASVRAGAAHDLRRRLAAGERPLPRVRPRDPAAREAPLLAPAACGRRLACDARSRGEDPHGRRPAARDLPLERRRLERARMPARRAGLPRPPHLHRRVPGQRDGRGARSEGVRRRGRPAAPRDPGAADDRRRLRAHRRRPRRAVRRPERVPDVVSLALDRRAREGRARRRRRRRALRRLQALRPAPAERVAARPADPRAQAPADARRPGRGEDRDRGRPGLARGVQPAVLRLHAGPAHVPPAGAAVRAGDVLAARRRSGRRSRHRSARDAARDRHGQLLPRVHPAQGRSLHDGARARAAHAAARPRLVPVPARAAARTALHDARQAPARRGLRAVRGDGALHAPEARVQPAAAAVAARGPGRAAGGRGRAARAIDGRTARGRRGGRDGRPLPARRAAHGGADPAAPRARRVAAAAARTGVASPG